MFKRSTLAVVVAFYCVQASYALSPGDRVVVTREGKAITGQIIELFPDDSKAVIKLVDGRTVVTLTDDIKHSLPPLLKGVTNRKWRSSDGKYTTNASLVDMKSGVVYLQKADGVVVSVNASRLSNPDVTYARKQSKTLPNASLGAGDSIKIVVPQSFPADRKEVVSTLASALKRSGYIVNNTADVELAVKFKREKSDSDEMIGLDGNREVNFTATTVDVFLVRKSKVLFRASYTTKMPFTLPGGVEGKQKLLKAETAVLPFLRTLAIPPRIVSGR